MSANKLQKVEDILEIQALKALFFEFIDNVRSDRDKAAARLREILAEDAQADYGDRGIMKGRENVIDFLLDLSTKPVWLVPMRPAISTVIIMIRASAQQNE